MAIGLEAVDYVNAYISCHDGTHFYGVKSGLAGTKFCRGTTYDNLAEIFDFATIAAGLSPNLAWSPAPGVVIACCVSASTQKGYLYKSIDSGASWAMVLRIGDTDGTDSGHITHSNAIPRSLCVDDHRGKLYFGEYNYNPSRVSGSTNDRVALWESNDNGATWSVVAIWNADGSTHQFRHIHGVIKDPYTHDIYIVTGEDGAGVIRWDSASQILDNTHPSDYTDWTTGVFGQGGSGKWRYCDFLFDENWIYGFSDSVQLNNRGIFRIAKDLSSIENIQNDVVNFALHSGYLGVKTANGGMHFIEFLETGGTDKQLNLYSGKNGAFALSAKYGAASAPTSPRQLMQVGSDIFISCSGAGKADLATAVVREVPFTEVKIVHPVYWVAKGGTDSTGYPRGHRPSSPWLTVQYAMTSNRMTLGARLIVGPGEFLENPISTAWAANARPGTGNVVIEGSGSENTIIKLKTGNESNYLLYLNTTDINSTFRRLRLATLSVTTGSLIRVRAGHVCRIEKSQVGERGVSSYMIFGLVGDVYLRETVLHGTTTDSLANITPDSKLYAESSIFIGFKEHAYVSGWTNVTLDLKNCVFYDYLNRSLVFASGTAFLLLNIKNCAFIGRSGAVPIVDAAGITETDEQIDYNYYNAASPSVANGGGSHSVTADPKFYDAAALDFHIKSDSPLRGVGVAVGVVTDFTSESFASPPPIGAYEYSDIRWGQKSNFDATMPDLTLAATAPGSLLEVQEWRRADVTKRQMDAVSR